MVNKNIVVSVGMLLGSNFVTRIIQVICIPLLMRLFPPAIFGDYSVILSLSVIGVAFVTGKYELAIPLAKNNYEAIEIFLAAVFFMLLICVILLAAYSISFLFDKNLIGIGKAIPLLCVVLLSGLGNIFENYYARLKKYKLLAVSNTLRVVSKCAFQIMFGLLGFKFFGLAIGLLVGFLFALLPYVFGYKKEHFEKFNFNLKSIVGRLKKNIKFPMYSMPTKLANVIALQLPTLIIYHFFGSEYAGIYAMIQIILGLPIYMIGSACSQVIYPAIASLNSERERKEHVELFIYALLVLSIAGFGFFLVLGNHIYGLVLGSKWLNLPYYLKILVPAFIFQFVASPFSQLPAIFGKQKTSFNISLVEMVVRLAVVLVGVYFNSFDLAIILYSVVGVINYIFYTAWIMSLFNVSLFRIFSLNRSYFLMGAAFLFFVGFDGQLLNVLAVQIIFLLLWALYALFSIKRIWSVIYV